MDDWIPFIEHRFEQADKHMPKGLVAGLCAPIEGHPYYTQHFAHDLRESLTPNQRTLLRGLAPARLVVAPVRIGFPAFTTFFPMIGTTLSHYRIVSELGRGGMGVVYLAEDTKLDRQVAIKVLPSNALAGDDDRARFYREAKAAAALNHPNIAQVYQIDEAVPSDAAGRPTGGSGTQPSPFIAMEYIDGESLEARIKRGPLKLAEAERIATEIAGALGEAHEEGIVHRDVKPSNVMVTPRGRVKILDFGVAQMSQSPGLTRTGATVGTITYMSPEQARGEPVDHRTDIWALGVVLYEMLTGRKPFSGAYEAAVVYSIINERHDPLKADAADVPARLTRAVDRMLAKNRDDRFQSMADVVSALDAAQSPRADIAAPSDRAEEGGDDDGERTGDSMSVATTGWLRPSDRRSVVVGVVALLLALVLVIGYFSLRTPGSGSFDSIAVLPLENISGDAEAQPFVSGIHEGLLTELSRLSKLKVISRTSVLQYAGVTRSLPEIADELGVSAILEGTVQRADDRVSVSVKLIDGARDRQLWADSYNRRLTTDNIFELQADLARTIARQLEAQLGPDERPNPERTPTNDLEAYRLNAEGRALMDERTESGMRAAVRLFERAVARDSTYAMAWVGLSDALRLLHDYAFESGDEAIARAEEAANRALELAPGLAEAHASRGMVYEARHNGPAALRELERALEIRPGYPEIHHWMSWVHRLLGSPERALESAHRAVALNPLSLEAISNLSFSYMETGDFENGLLEARRIVELQPSWTTGHLIEGMALYYTGDYDEARSNLEGLSVPWAGAGPLGTLALVQIATGDTALARQSLTRLERAGDAFNSGIVRAALGDIDAAFEEFARVERWNDYWPTFVVRYHFQDVLSALRSDPRFEDYLRRVDASWAVEGN